MAVMVPWLNICNMAPLSPACVNAAMPTRQKPMWLTDE